MISQWKWPVYREIIFFIHTISTDLFLWAATKWLESDRWKDRLLTFRRQEFLNSVQDQYLESEERGQTDDGQAIVRRNLVPWFHDSGWIKVVERASSIAFSGRGKLLGFSAVLLKGQTRYTHSGIKHLYRETFSRQGEHSASAPLPVQPRETNASGTMCPLGAIRVTDTRRLVPWSRLGGPRAPNKRRLTIGWWMN